MRFTRDALLLLSIGGVSTLSALALRSAFPSKPQELLVVVGSASKNLGTLLQDEIAQADFLLRNQSSRPIKIKETIRSCGCTEPRFSSLEIVPGGTSRVQLMLKTGSNRGHLVTTTSVLYSQVLAKTSSDLRLELVCDVLPDYDVTPPRLWFGPNLPLVETVSLKPHMLQSLDVTDAISSHRCLKCKVGRDLNKKSYTLTIKYCPELYLVDDGPPTVVVVTNSKRQPRYRVPLSVVRPPVTQEASSAR
jgi:hypothetical protein